MTSHKNTKSYPPHPVTVPSGLGKTVQTACWPVAFWYPAVVKQNTIQQKEKALLPLLSNEASIAFEQYQAAVQCRNSTVLEQAYASGYRTAVQMFAAGLGPQPPVPEHGEDNNG